MEGLLGRLDWSYIPSDPVTIGAAVGMPLALLFIAGAITYFKKWKYLWTEWITTTDAKKIGVMYAIVSIVMLLRGGADALMLRAATAFGGPGGQKLFDTDTFQQVFTAHGTIMIFFVGMGLWLVDHKDTLTKPL